METLTKSEKIKGIIGSIILLPLLGVVLYIPLSGFISTLHAQTYNDPILQSLTSGIEAWFLLVSILIIFFMLFIIFGLVSIINTKTN